MSSKQLRRSRREPPANVVGSISTGLRLPPSGANNYYYAQVGGGGPELPGSNNDGVNYVYLGDGSGQGQEQVQGQAPPQRLGCRPRRPYRRLLEEPEDEEPEGNTTSHWIKFFGWVTSLVSMVGIKDQQGKSKKIPCFLVATLFVGGATLLAAEYPAWHATGKFMCYICVLMLVGALVDAIPACTEFVSKIKEFFQQLAAIPPLLSRVISGMPGMPPTAPAPPSI